jgi:hypothetical protein
MVKSSFDLIVIAPSAGGAVGGAFFLSIVYENAFFLKLFFELVLFV